jgi:hypothetical protein
MSQTSPPSITASPTAPQRNDRTTFSTRVDAFVTWLIAAVTQFSAVATNVYNNAVDCYNNAVTVAGNTATTVAAANYKGEWSAQVGAAAIPYSVSYKGIFYHLIANVADVTAHNPATDSATWTQSSFPSPVGGYIITRNLFGAF